MGWDSDRGSGVERNLYDRTCDGKKRERESEKGKGTEKSMTAGRKRAKKEERKGRKAGSEDTK